MLMVLALAYLIEGSFGSTVPFLGGTGHQKAQTKIAATDGIVGFVLSIILVKPFGLIGVAFGFLLGSTIVNNAICSWYICRCMEIPAKRFYLESLLRPWLLLAILVVLAYTTKISHFIHNWPSIMVAGLILGSLYLVCSYYFILKASERERFGRAVRKYLSSSKRLFGIAVKE